MILVYLVITVWLERSIAAPPPPASPPHQLTPHEVIDIDDPGIYFTAIGDSYAAGIGAGNVGKEKGDSGCSRYTGAYSDVINTLIGPKANFVNVACSGHLSGEVKKQVDTLKDGSQDLVTVSAGGNDALLADVLKACVYYPGSQEKCDKALEKTKKAIDNDLQENIADLLKALDSKVKAQGYIVYTLYGQFFNAETDECSQQTWNWFNTVIPGSSGIKLSKGLRMKLNKLVLEANSKLGAAIKGHSRQIAIADWDQAAGDLHGRFCEKGSDPDPDHPSNAGLVFQRLNTQPHNTPSRKAAARKRELEKRAPDEIARVFHPTIRGQELIAARALIALIDLIAGKDKAKFGKKCEQAPEECLATSNKGINKDDYIKARDKWCKGNSKSFDQKYEYKQTLSFDFTKKDGNCPSAEDDCVRSLNAAWNKCAEYHSRPTDDKSPLKEKNGPFKGKRVISSDCGSYKVEVSDPPDNEEKKGTTPECGVLHQRACNNKYKVDFVTSTLGNGYALSWTVKGTSYDKHTGTKLEPLQTFRDKNDNIQFKLGGKRDSLEVTVEDHMKGDSALQFRYWDMLTDKKWDAYYTYTSSHATQRQEGEVIFTCDSPEKKDDGRHIVCYFHAGLMVSEPWRNPVPH